MFNNAWRTMALWPVGLLLLMAACGGSSPTSPSSTSTTSTTSAASEPIYWMGVVASDDLSQVGSVVVSTDASTTAASATGTVVPLRTWDAVGQISLPKQGSPPPLIVSMKGTYDDVFGHWKVQGSGWTLEWDSRPTPGLASYQVTGNTTCEGVPCTFTLTTAEKKDSIGVGPPTVFCGNFGSTNSDARGSMAISLRGSAAVGQGTDKTGSVQVSGNLQGETLTMSWRGKNGLTGSLTGTRRVVSPLDTQISGTWSNSDGERGSFGVSSLGCQASGGVRF